MTSVISSKQLQYAYQWNAIPPDDPRITGKPDAIFLNRNEGYEVLNFLNRNCSDTPAALKAESLIRTQLPGYVRSRENVLQWLKVNWL